MIALAVVYLVGALLILAVIWHECDKADRAEEELERRMAAYEAARWEMSDPGNSREQPRHIP